MRERSISCCCVPVLRRRYRTVYFTPFPSAVGIRVYRDKATILHTQSGLASLANATFLLVLAGCISRP